MPRLSQTRRDLLNGLMKDTIFTATTSVLCQHGVDGTTMSRVAEAAGLSKSSLYDYFSSKNELLTFVVSRMFAPTVEAFGELLRMDVSAAEKLRRIARMALASVEQHRASLLLFLREDLRSVTESSRLEFRPQVIETLSAIFTQGIADGHFRQEEVVAVSRMFLGCLGEMCEMWLASDPPEPVEQRVKRERRGRAERSAICRKARQGGRIPSVVWRLASFAFSSPLNSLPSPVLAQRPSPTARASPQPE